MMLDLYHCCRAICLCFGKLEIIISVRYVFVLHYLGVKPFYCWCATEAFVPYKPRVGGDRLSIA